MPSDLEPIYTSLYSYCEERGFAGLDPFDGLNSAVFQWTPLRHSRLARLAWLQIVKRTSIDLRPALRVRSGVNPKGMALFALAELSRFRATRHHIHKARAIGLLDRLKGERITGRSRRGNETASFGYNFDWQSRSFYAPRGTPAIIPTGFASQALVEATIAFEDPTYLNLAEQICEFILAALNKHEGNDEVCFSYTPVDESRIFNASLIAGESLARVGMLTGNTEYLDSAAKTVRYVVRRQRPDGAWTYGEAGTQAWADNFHTAYILLSIHRISQHMPALTKECEPAFRSGMNYWLNNFFLSDGTPKYYDNEVYPIDIHAAAVAISTLAELSPRDEGSLPMARRVADWTIANMRDPEGFFYYQKTRKNTIRTPFMRWGQAWMAYALGRLMETTAKAEC